MTTQSPLAIETAGRHYAYLRTKVAAAAAANDGVALEDHLRAPVQALVESVAEDLGYPKLVLAGEISGAVAGARPDYTVMRGGLIIGHIELKAPGAGVDPDEFTGHNLEQWQQLRHLPNLLYSDGIDWVLWQDGQQVARATAWTAPSKGITSARIEAGDLVDLIDTFCADAAQAPATAQELARTTARLCRVLRKQIIGTLESGGSKGLEAVAEDWRSLLFPDASDDKFADAYSQTITFGLIAARAAGAGLTTGNSVAERVAQATSVLDADVGLIPTALRVLCSESAIGPIEPAVESLLSLLAATDPALLNDAGDWLYFYEDFLAQYDPDLRKESGSYYTPAELVKFIVRLVDEVLRTRLGQPSGFADEAVTVIDPAVGTGTFLLQIIDRIASVIPEDVFACVAGVCAHPAYTAWFNEVSPHTPGIRVPITADGDYWSMAVGIGRRVIWAHTFGERCIDGDDGRPAGRVRPPNGPKLRSETGEGTHNRMFSYDAEQRVLRIGDGVFDNVSPEIHAYEVSGTNVVRSWFNYRRAGKGSRDSNSLESITPDGWRPEWDIELLDILNALTALVALEPEQAELLAAIIDGPQVTVEDLAAAEVLPVPAEAKKAPKVEKKPAPAQTTLV